MSGRKNTLLKFQNITNGNMAGNVTSVVSNIEFLDNIGIQLVFTGSPVGTFTVEISADHAQDQNGNVSVAGNWVAIDLDPVPVAAGSADVIAINIDLMSFPWMRVVYTRTSGTGTLNGYICAKMI